LRLAASEVSTRRSAGTPEAELGLGLRLQELDDLGYDAIQGFHISRPVPADDLISWLEQQTAKPSPQPHH
jgi:hypothetical protein